jgi:hypothetical protein
LLCLLLDGHDWASTQYMKKTNGLTGMSLSSKGASNYAASCIVGAINANAKSLLLKLTGVDLSLVVSPTPMNGETLSEESPADGGNRDRDVGGVTRKYSDTLTRNERVLKFLQENRRPASGSKTVSNKRKNADEAHVDAVAAGYSETSEPTHPKYQRLDAHGPVKSSSSSGSIGSNSDAVATATTTTAAPVSAPSYSSRRPPRVGLPSRGSIVQFPTMPAENRLSLKSPRYESTMEIQVRKVILDIANLPFNADEYATLQTYYLGGCMSPKDEDEATRANADDVPAEGTRKNSISCADAIVEDPREPNLCPACRTSRLAKFRRVMALKARLESRKEATEAKLLVILRQLHYLIGVFQHVDNGDQTIDNILVSVHDPSLLGSPPRPRQPTIGLSPQR